MSNIQTEFLKELSIKETNKIDVLNKYINKVSYNDINAENINKIDLNQCNIYIEFLVKNIIDNRFFDVNAIDDINISLLFVYMSYYHIYLFPYLFANMSIKEFNKIRLEMLKSLEDIKQVNYNKLLTDNKKKFNNLEKLLNIELSEDVSKISALEYCYFVTWAKYKKEFVDVPKQVITSNNDNDILCINVTYNLNSLDSIIMYNNVEDDPIPVLTSELIKTTKRYQSVPPKNKANEPITLYDKKFNRIKKLRTNNVTVLLDYGNNYYTKLFITYENEIPLRFANNIINRKIICNHNKRLLYDVVYKDIYNFLPIECYENKHSKSQLMESIDKMRRIVSTCYDTNKNKHIDNIITSDMLKEILHEKEIPIFKVYISYLKKLDNVDLNTIIKHCTEYFYDTNITL